MRAAADRLDARREELARLMAPRDGQAARAGPRRGGEVRLGLPVLRGRGAGLPGRRATSRPTRRSSFVAFEPLGPVLAVMPWNFPFWQVFRFAAPALMAGNAGLLKHAANVTGCALAIEAHLPRRRASRRPLFRALLVGSERVADVIEAREVKAVTLTGSTPAGQAVAARAGAVLKKTVLELGGSDPYLVLEDADLDAAAETCAASRLINGGQSCIAAKRFIVVEAVRDAFEERFVERMRGATGGRPARGRRRPGPAGARATCATRCTQQVEASVRAGRARAAGRRGPGPGPGAFYPPTVLADVAQGHGRVRRGDLRARGGRHRRAGRGGRDRASPTTARSGSARRSSRATWRAASGSRRELEAGSCFVNALVHSDPRLPFGGIKESGYGRELADFGIREFVNIKTVYIK